MDTVPRFFKKTAESFFLFGPRGTGKTTWIREQIPGAIVINLLEADTFRQFSAYPERLKELVLAAEKHKPIVIDEVQKLPTILDIVHDLIERDKGRQFILTGSSSRKLKHSGVDLLAGRAIFKTLHPFMASELGAQFSLSGAIRTGLLPLVFGARNPEETLRAYLSLYIREEVQFEGLVRNIGNFSRFLEVISFSHGSFLNISNVSRECQVERKAVEAYVSILEDLMLGFRLNVFQKKAKRELVSHPKWYLFDAGVYRSLRPKGPLDRPEEIEGGALEGLIAQHLRAWIAYGNEEFQLYFWRTSAGTEVDFVLYGPSGIWAIEVKNSSGIRPQDLRALKSFQREYPESVTILLYRGKDVLKKGNIWCIPCEKFLKELRPDRKIWG